MKDEIGDYCKVIENKQRIYLDSDKPIIIRLDGKSFHTWTKSFDYPYSVELKNIFRKTLLSLVENINCIIIGYYQSDEVTLVLGGYKDNSEQLFKGNIQKITSTSASIFTAIFNKYAQEWNYSNNTKLWNNSQGKYGCMKELPLAFFDSRVFQVKESDIETVLWWRLMDAKRNSVSTLAQSLYSPKELHGKMNSEMKEMIIQKGKDWDKEPNEYKQGFWLIKKPIEIGTPNGLVIRNKYFIEDDLCIKDYLMSIGIECETKQNILENE